MSTRNFTHPERGKKINWSGYVMVWNVEERRYIREHRMIIEKHLGRKLLKTEHIHHKNGIKTDNRLSNLILISPQQHIRLGWENGTYKNVGNILRDKWRKGIMEKSIKTQFKKGHYPKRWLNRIVP